MRSTSVLVIFFLVVRGGCLPYLCKKSVGKYQNSYNRKNHCTPGNDYKNSLSPTVNSSAVRELQTKSQVKENIETAIVNK